MCLLSVVCPWFESSMYDIVLIGWLQLRETSKLRVRFTCIVAFIRSGIRSPEESRFMSGKLMYVALMSYCNVPCEDNVFFPYS